MADKEIIKKGEDFVKEFLNLLQVKAEAKLSMEIDEEDTKFLKVSIEGEDLGSLISYKGFTLNAIQTIVAQIISKEIGEQVMVMVDVNGYREKRKSYLQSLAKRAYEEARESGQNIGLPPLSSYERRVIHMALKDEKGIMTESEGEGDERHVVVKINKTKKEAEKPTFAKATVGRQKRNN